MGLFEKGYSYQRLNEMVDKAIDGTFQESDYTESELSKLEVKWMRFLTESSLSRQKIRQDREQMKALVSDISHQTRTPLANLKLYGELLMERDLDEESRQLAENISRQSARLEFLIQALVKISRLETGTIQVEPKPGLLEPLLKELETMAAQKAKASQITLQFPANCRARACYDGKWTTEGIYNILDNAIKYSPAGSQITLTVEEYEMFTCIAVTDQGIGISEQELGQIFTRFYRSPRVHHQEGIGLGLYLARELISASGGYIKVKSREGQGSTFAVYLPRE